MATDRQEGDFFGDDFGQKVRKSLDSSMTSSLWLWLPCFTRSSSLDDFLAFEPRSYVSM